MSDFRLVHFETSIGDYYDIHEVFYDDNGNIIGISSDGVAYGDNIDEVQWAVDSINEAFEKPILENPKLNTRRFCQ